MYKRLPYLFAACTNHIHKPPSSSLLHQPFVLPPPLRHISRSLNHPMSSSTANTDAPAPYTGTLRYPLDALITLARSIVKAKEDHHIALRDAANAANDEDEESEQSYDLDDVDHCIYAVDGQRWKARAISEGRVPGKGWDSLALQHFEDPRASEKGLFRMYGKAARVIKEAIQLRKDTRGDAPSDDLRWCKEDALLDLLELITKHKDLFAPSED